jgi:hypothetical protein
MSRSREPQTLEEAQRIWKEHRAFMNGQSKIILDLRATITRITTELEQLRKEQQ